jgi:hypothetical protein
MSALLAGCQPSVSLDSTDQTPIVSPVPYALPHSPVSSSITTATLQKQRLALKPGNLAVPFIPNNGQLDSRVLYYLRTFGGSVFVTRDGELVYSLSNSAKVKQGSHRSETAIQPRRTLVFAEKILTTTEVNITPREETIGTVSIFHGKDPATWQENLPSFQEISLGTLYPGIEVRLTAHGSSIEKLFFIEKEADPQNISIQVSDGARLSIKETGQLTIATDAGSALFSNPIAWQDIGGQHRNVEVAYALNDTDSRQYGFDLGPYDPNYPLVIDPLLQTTYLGGSANDEGMDIAIGPNGDIYVAGETSSTDFPTCTSSIGMCATGYDHSFTGSSEAFVARITADLQRLVQTTYLGGNGSESAEALVIDASGNVYITGDTDSSDFPGVAGGADSILSNKDGFVARLSSDLRSLTQSTYVGGSGFETPHDIAISNSNEIIIVGTTSSADLPACSSGMLACLPPGRPDETFAGSTEGFVARFNLDLTTMYATTYLGGSNNDSIYGVAVSEDDLHVCGSTNSSDFPFIDNGVDTNQVDYEAFVTRIKDDLSTLNQSTYFGGAGHDECYAITKGIDGQVYITGETSSADLPSCQGPNCPGKADTTVDNNGDAYVAKLSTDLKNIYGSTYLGGTGFDMGTGIAVAPAPWNPWESMVYVTGETYADDFPRSGNGADPVFAGASEGFVAYLNNSLSNIEQTSYFGGNHIDFPTALTVSAAGDIYITGKTRSNDLPRRQEGFDTGLDGNYDAFVARFSNLKGDGSAFYIIPLKNGKAAIINL